VASNRDFKDLFSALSVADARFLVVGAHAVMLYTAPRYTKDLDIWVEPTRENAERVHAALIAFGAPMSDLAVGDLAELGTIFQMGVEPNRIDVITSIDGVDLRRRSHPAAGNCRSPGEQEAGQSRSRPDRRGQVGSGAAPETVGRRP
jgi:hypothetical protein